MNGQTLVEDVRAEKRTELDRLGSEKGLLAATNADLETGAVLGVVATTTGGLHEQFSAWAASTPGAVGDAFAAAAEEADETHGQLRAELDAELDEQPAAVAALEPFDETVEQVGSGLVGSGLVLDRTLLQVINFFVNEADSRHADQFRDVRTTANDWVDEGERLLDELAETERDWDRAGEAAEQVIDAAYGEYVETLDGLGIDPKPVC